VSQNVEFLHETQKSEHGTGVGEDVAVGVGVDY
jgi:hypothetical protein